MPKKYNLTFLLWSGLFLTTIACQIPKTNNNETITGIVVYSDSIPLLGKLLSEDSLLFYRQYDSVKSIIDKDRRHFYQTYQNATNKDSILNLAGDYLHQSIAHNLLPFWYGTTWDFNGYTAVPRQGVIACGYLVSTTLRQSGVVINRYKLAQQASATIVKNTCTQIQSIQGFPEFIKALSSLKDGLYVVGLDNHVGYISVENGSAYFLHASYLSPGVACREKISESTVLLFSKTFVLGNLSQNKTLLKAWLTGLTLPVIP